VWSNAIASVSGAFMHFATLTEVPIVQGLIGNGMGKGPALALLLAGPALSLPSMLVINSIMGCKTTFVFVSLVRVLSTIAGMLFGASWISCGGNDLPRQQFLLMGKVFQGKNYAQLVMTSITRRT
jgi:uncharacterized protein